MCGGVKRLRRGLARGPRARPAQERGRRRAKTAGSTTPPSGPGSLACPCVSPVWPRNRNAPLPHGPRPSPPSIIPIQHSRKRNPSFALRQAGRSLLSTRPLWVGARHKDRRARTHVDAGLVRKLDAPSNGNLPRRAGVGCPRTDRRSTHTTSRGIIPCSNRSSETSAAQRLPSTQSSLACWPWSSSEP